jgi:hypothetical protein
MLNPVIPAIGGCFILRTFPFPIPRRTCHPPPPTKSETQAAFASVKLTRRANLRL